VGRCQNLARRLRVTPNRNERFHGIDVLGFFDGAISSRIGVYLLDGPRGAEDPKVYYKGSEYLQLYDELTDDNLEAFLKRNAVRERRIDNVAGAFVWLEHLVQESVANPTNVSLGVMEWFTEHAARFWRVQGNSVLAELFTQLKMELDDARIALAPSFRFPFFDELQRFVSPPLSSGNTMQSLMTRVIPEGPDGSNAVQQVMAAWKPFMAGWANMADLLLLAQARGLREGEPEKWHGLQT
jgi:hypothetical protein